jgi:butyryl-CoA dehydrogenase
LSEFTGDQIAIRDMTRNVVAKEIAPFAAQWDRDGTTPLDTLRRLGALGLFGMTMPGEWGGAEIDFVGYVLATEELAYGDAGVCNAVNATNSYCFKVRDFGTEAQKEEFLRPVASGQNIGCMLLTEPHTGSDAANIRTRAELQGDHYVVNGVKTFITSGRSSNMAVLIAVTDPAAGKRGISAFLIRTDQPGYTVVREEIKMGHRASDTCEIALDNLEIPVANMLGASGQGLRVALSGLESGRIAVAAQAVGIARAALDAAMAYAREREAFGKKIFDHQAVAFSLADMAMEIEVARQMCHHAARMKQAGKRCVKESSIAKLFASQMCERVCSAAIQAHGGVGFTNDYPVEKLYRDAKVLQIYDGTNEVQKIIISRELAAEY